VHPREFHFVFADAERFEPRLTRHLDAVCALLFMPREVHVHVAHPCLKVDKRDIRILDVKRLAGYQPA